MKEQIEYLVSKGLTREEALNVVESVAREAFTDGGDNIEYTEEYGWDFKVVFDYWFKEKLK